MTGDSDETVTPLEHWCGCMGCTVWREQHGIERQPRPAALQARIDEQRQRERMAVGESV